jgi:diacylglycerol O-acyltransferase
MVVSNVAGPAFQIYLADVVVERLAPLGPVMLEVELNITCASYYGFIDPGFATTPEIANDIDN